VESILYTLGMDLNDDSLAGTPNRVAKMFVKEIFGGLNPAKKPSSSTFDNNYKYGEMLVEKILLYIQHANIIITNNWSSTCSLYFKRQSYWIVKNE